MQSRLPGRLGDPNMTPTTDPRMDPRVASVIAATGDIGDAIEPVDENAPYQACVEYGTKLEALMSLPHAQTCSDARLQRRGAIHGSHSRR